IGETSVTDESTRHYEGARGPAEAQRGHITKNKSEDAAHTTAACGLVQCLISGLSIVSGQLTEPQKPSNQALLSKFSCFLILSSAVPYDGECFRTCMPEAGMGVTVDDPALLVSAVAPSGVGDPLVVTRERNFGAASRRLSTQRFHF
ncbi:MAG TPA: hypothetical protein VG096_23190, partial [Bryobacteraceae bacterium]|nr:hypothetical protein [Bryobacteraceae bacterium]